MTTSPSPEGPGSASGAPNLPAGFAGTFTSRYIHTGDLRQHVVTGGGGPPLLLIHGWPGSWYYWRLVMPALQRAKPAALKSAGLCFQSVALPKQQRQTRIVKDMPAPDIAREIAAWMGEE